MVLDVGEAVGIAILVALVAGPAVWAFRHYAVAEDLRTVVRVFRLDGPALAVGGFALLGSVALVAVAFEPGAPLAMLLAGSLLALGVAGVTIAAANVDWYLATRRLPVVDPGDVEPGPVQLSGNAVANEEFVQSSVTDTDALAYRAVTRQEHAILGRGYASSTWVVKSVAHDAVPSRVVDGAALGDDVPGGDGAADGGRELPASLRSELDQSDPSLPPDAASIAVRTDDAAFPLLSPTSRLVRGSPAGATLDGLERTVPAEPGTTVPVADDLDRGTRPRPRQYSERRIDAGDPVYVLGTAHETADGEIEIVDDPDGPPLIVVRTPAAEAIAHAKRFGRNYAILGIASLAAGAWLLASVGL